MHGTTKQKVLDMKLEWTGPLTMIEQEGGYLAPSIVIGDNYPIIDMQEAFVHSEIRAGYKWKVEVPGTWKLTLERTEDA